jgi:hypothetical protein
VDGAAGLAAFAEAVTVRDPAAASVVVPEALLATITRLGSIFA